MSPLIPYGRQSISPEDVEAVLRVLRSDFLTQGPEIEAFEKAAAGFCGATHAVAVSSATSALHIACLAAGLGPGDRLWTSPNTFVASANCALYCGAHPDFVDIDPDTGNMDAAALERKLREARVMGTLPKVVVPVHFAGQPCDMEAIGRLAGEYGFTVIEDASHALGAFHRDSRVGGCDRSGMAVFSFHPVKIATTGEGGMVLTRDAALAEKLALLRSHGITRDPARMGGRCPGPWYYEQQELGFNYRMNDIEAALGRSQLGRLDAFVDRRRELASRYDSLLGNLPLRPLAERPWARSSCHLYVVRLDLAAMGKTQAGVFEAMRAAGIGVNLHYIPVHTQPYYRGLGFRPGDFPEAERYAAEALTLPLYYGLTDADQDRAIEALKRAAG
jgi:UDP-4-amino-4,6-dideoxy-N-acetyl-beta-L-altrosamine transaminase